MIYGYLRKSSEEGRVSSFDTQKFKINSYCNIHNLRVESLGKEKYNQKDRDLSQGVIHLVSLI